MSAHLGKGILVAPTTAQGWVQVVNVLPSALPLPPAPQVSAHLIPEEGTLNPLPGWERVQKAGLLLLLAHLYYSTFVP